MSEKILRVSRILLQKKRGAEAVWYLYEGIRQDSTNAHLYACLGDALKQSLEYDVALKIYRKALYLAQQQKNAALIGELNTKIETIYVLNPMDVVKGPQIGFFIRTLMKMLSKLGKQDWF